MKVGYEDAEEKIRRKDTNIIEMNEGFLYKLIFRKAVGDVNEVYQDTLSFIEKTYKDKKILKTIWDRMGMQNPVAPYTDYFST